MEIILEGKVQGVGIRNFVRRKALALKLTGCVENLKDGTVRILAQGEEEKLKLFLVKLRKGSLVLALSQGKVTGIKVTETEPLEIQEFKKI